MKLIFLTLTVALSISFCTAVEPHEHNKVVCYWNSTSFERPGLGKFQVEDLRPALAFCTHLIYGFAGIDAATFEAISLNPNLDTGAGYGFYKLVVQLKRLFPDLKIYLSIGGNADPDEETHKYLTLLETQETRTKFINSVVRLLSEYEFDGVDLAWQFPPDKVKKDRGTVGKLRHGIENTFEYDKFKDEEEEEHRSGFTNLVRDLKTQVRARNKTLTLTVLPHVNGSVYYDARLITPNLEAVHLMAFDQRTPERTPKEADYAAPIYESCERSPQNSIDSSVRHWLEQGTPAGKIVVGIPAFARTWKLSIKSKISGVPPIVTNGPGDAGPHTVTPGLLSYAEVCARLTVDRLRRVGDPSKKYGSYAYQSYNEETGVDGIWISYEDPDTAGDKGTYAKDKNLGGIAIWDLSTDDFHGICTGNKYPILKSAAFFSSLIFI